MPLPEAEMLAVYWLEVPPPHVTLSAIAHGLSGVKPNSSRPATRKGVGTAEEGALFAAQMKTFAQQIASGTFH